MHTSWPYWPLLSSKVMRAETGVLALSMMTESISPPPFLDLRKWINSLSFSFSSTMSVGRPLTLTVLPGSAICWEKHNQWCGEKNGDTLTQRCHDSTQTVSMSIHSMMSKSKNRTPLHHAVNVSIRKPCTDSTLSNKRRDIFDNITPSIGGYCDITSTLLKKPPFKVPSPSLFC